MGAAVFLCILLALALAVTLGAPWWIVMVGLLVVVIVGLLALLSQSMSWPGW